jgi:sugar lactone lactonase YvrE
MSLYRAAQKTFLSVLFSLLLFLIAVTAGKVFVYAVPTSPTSATNIPSSYVDIGQPHGMVMLPNGNIWYVDRADARIVQYDPSTNTIVRTVGRSGSGEGEFHWTIYNITRDTAGDLYVLAGEHSVYKLDSNGGLLQVYDTDAISNHHCWDPRGIAYDATNHLFYITDIAYDTVTVYNADFSYLGMISGSFVDPWGITTDTNGRIYVIDAGTGPGRLQVFNHDRSPAFQITSWTDGGNQKYFDTPQSALILSDGTISVTSYGDHTIDQFTSSGTFIRTWSFYGDGRVSDMSNPEFMVKDGSDNIYVSDWWLNSITKYTSTGGYIKTFRNNLIAANKLLYPSDVAYGPNNDLYVLDGGSSNARLVRFSNDGSDQTTVLTQGETGLGGQSNDLTFGPDGKLYISSVNDVRVFSTPDEGDTWTLDYIIGSNGTGDGQFADARDIAFYNSEANGEEMFVADRVNSRIQVFDIVEGEYQYLTKITSTWNEFAYPFIPAVTGQLADPNGLVVTSAGKLIVGNDSNTVMQYDADTLAYENDIGVRGNDDPTKYVLPTALSLDASGNLYVTDAWGPKVMEYSPTGVLLDSYGKGGSQQLEFNSPGGSAANPVTGTLTITDSLNGRVQSISTGYRIINLIPSGNVIIRTHIGDESSAMDAFAGQSLSEQSWDPVAHDLSAIPARLMFGDYVVADFTVDLSTSDQDWTSVNVQSLPGDSKALVVNMNQDNAPGISDTHSLYVYKYANQTSVNVCPQATLLEDVGPLCTDEYSLSLPDNADVLSVQAIGGKNYWKIEGLTGTGAFSTLFETSFELSDLMTREQVSTPSSHQLNFGTGYDLTHTADTITITFGTAWDLSPVVANFSDLVLKRVNTSLPLVNGAADTDVWGVAIDTDASTITFTAPANSGSTYDIGAGTAITVLINNARLVNPASADTYEIDLRLISDAGGGEQNIETGSVTVPIIDSDQVDVTGYVNNYLAFDIDTRTEGEPTCGFTSCSIYADGPTGTNYTVDLGELGSTWVNKSQDAAVMHSDGETAAINSIYLDLTSNAINGTVVTVASANGGLQGPQTMIPSVENGGNITANSGKYGYNFYDWDASNGVVYPNDYCWDADTYCALTTDPVTVFDTGSAPVDGGWVRMDIAAAAAYTDSPGSYTDTLTFVATGSF